MTTDINTNHLKEYALAETKRHKPCLIYRGHRYVQDKLQNRTIYWRCEDRAHCNGRAHQLIGNDSLPILTIKHNHPPIIDDLSRHDIVSVDSHRRRRRQQQQNRKISSEYQNEKDINKDELLLSSNMNSSIKFENKQQRQSAMGKNLHLSEVITTATAPHIHHTNHINTHRQTTVDPMEMTKLLNNITATNSTSVSRNASSKTNSTIDYSSRLNQFSWEEIEGRYLPVIYRHENGIYQRYTSKMYVENTLFQSESWQRHLMLARSLPPLVSYTYTEHELKLFRIIVAWHLASFYFKTVPSTDCLIRFEDLLDFYNTLRKLRDAIPTTTTPPTLNRPTPPPPPVSMSASVVSSSSKSDPFELPTQITQRRKLSSETQLQQDRPIPSDKSHLKDSGWVQINNVFVPYIIKLKFRDNESSKSSKVQREYYVPYEILVKCNIFTDQEFLFKKFLIKATQQDFDILNNLITNINIFDEKVPEKTLLVNLYHVMVGLNRILYIKFLPTKQPRTQVNKYHMEVLTHKGGTLLMNGNKLIPYIVQNNHFYVPLLYTFHSLPHLLIQAKRDARAPRQYEIDYLNLLFIYFSIDIPPLTSDTLLVDIFNIKCTNLQTPIHFRTLHEHQQYEKNKLTNSTKRTTQATKSSTTSTSTHKTNKCPPANVVVNPMIHHPSFYGLTSPKAVLPQKQVEIKSINFDNHPLNAIVKSPDLLPNDWKISIKEIFQTFSFDIDYEKFLQWCQTNLLLPLIKLDDEEKQTVKNNATDDDYYIYQRHLDRCISLLNDLKRGSISMTLLPSNNSNTTTESQQSTVKSPIAGAKKRKATVPTTRHVPTMDEIDSIPQDIEYSTTSELPVSEEIPNDIPMETSTNDAIIANTTAEVVDDDDDDIMPVVASVEEEQPLEDCNQSEMDTTFVIVETSDGNDEKIQLDDTNPSCSSGYESSTVLTNINNNNNNTNNISQGNQDDDDDDDETVSTTNSSKKTKKKRPRNHYTKSRARSRSSTISHLLKKARVNPTPNTNNDELDDDNSSLIVMITSDKIEQHLRTLFMASHELRRTRTRPVKTPTRLVEEINTNPTTNHQNSMKSIESDTNLFDILTATTTTTTMTTTDTINDNDSADNDQQSCTYNVVISDKPNKLGLTIKKVVQP